ncbi:MAG TPA: hypothetical protein DHW42_00730 [Candidatus Marinimicrobia bacterium]|nr:hypothetical protein [Candidatus Neomarinimicrobiota bacterium]
MKNSSKLYKQICAYLGCDLDSEPCQQIKDHLTKCPGCKVYIDKIKKTVKLYKIADNCDDIPKDICNKLFVSLNIDSASRSGKESDK